MKRVIPLILLICPIVSICEELPDMNEQILDAQIEKLTQERDEKYAALQECARKTKGFKIAGITTLAATGVGIYANIKLAQKRNGKDSNGGGKSAATFGRPSGTDQERKIRSCQQVCDTTDLEECARCLEDDS